MNEKRVKNLETMALKMLRMERKKSIEGARKAVKEQNKIIGAIRKALADEAKTVPELAAAARLESATVLMYISTLKKYGMVAEGSKDGDYFKYELIS